MTDEIGAAPAPAEPVAVADNSAAEPVSTPNPIETSNVDHEAIAKEKAAAKAAEEKAKKPRSTREALEEATKAVKSKADEKAKGDDAKAEKPQADTKSGKPEKSADTGAGEGTKPEKGAEQKTEREASQDEGAEKPSEKPTPTATQTDAPKRFSPDAQKDWATAPESIRSETNRAISELEKGLSEYQQRFEPIKKYYQMAEQNGTTVEAAMENYTRIDGLLQSNPIQGFQEIAKNLGYTLEQVAEHVLQRPADERMQAIQQENVRLSQENQDYKKQLGEFQAQAVETKSNEIKQVVEAFVSERLPSGELAHPRYDELEPLMVKLITNNTADTISEAYEMADRLKPAPTPVPQPKPVEMAAPDPTAHTDKGSKSIKGAPTAGSNPNARKQPSNSIRDSLKKALSQAG